MKLAVRIHSYVLQQILIKLYAAWRVFIGLPGDLIGQHLSVQGEYSMNHTGCHKQSYAQDTYLKLKLAEDLGAAAYTPPHHVIHLNTTGLIKPVTMSQTTENMLSFFLEFIFYLEIDVL